MVARARNPLASQPTQRSSGAPEGREARTLRVLCVLGIVTLLVAEASAAVRFGLAGMPWLVAGSALAVVALLAVSIALLGAGRLRAAQRTFMAGLAVPPAFAVAAGGYSFFSEHIRFLMLPMAAAVLLLRRRGLWTTFAALAGAVAVGVARAAGFLGGEGPHAPAPNFLPPALGLLVQLALLAALLDALGGTLTATLDELRRSDRRLRAFFDASNDAIFVNPILPDGSLGRFTEVNAVATQRLGWSRDELLGMTVPDVDPQFGSSAIQAKVLALVKGASPAVAVFESAHRARDGRVFPVEISSHRFELAGQPHVLSVVRDVSHRREAEEAIRALVVRVQSVREEEKARLARDLHDELGQLLTGIKMDLRWTERRLSELPAGEIVGAVTERIVDTSTLVDRTVASVQRLATELRPSALDQLGLGAALRQEARRFQQRSGIRCEVTCDEELPRLNGEAATALYRVAQEALTNVARHAQATRVVVALRSEPRVLTLRVEDDGRGIELPLPPSGALGLLGMKERAALFGGEVTVRRAPVGGTVVALEVPWARVAAPPEVNASP